MRYALIGCGRIAEKHLQAARQCGLDIVALCDPDPDQALRFGLSVPVYESCEALAEAQAPQLAAVAAPSGAHAEIALPLIRRGIHVIVEKPMALRTADAALIEYEACRMGVLAVPCHQNRYNAAAAWVKKQVASGRLGRLLYGSVALRWRRDEQYYRQAGWRGKWVSDGGVLMNQGIHAVDMLLWMLGQPVRIRGGIANMDHPYIETEDFAAAHIEFKEGALGLIEATSAAYPHNLEESLCLFGTQGSLKLGGVSMNRVEYCHLSDRAEPPVCREPADIYGFGHLALYRDVVRAIRRGKLAQITTRDGRMAVETVLGVYRSALENRIISPGDGDFDAGWMAGYFKGV